ncbi:tyrosine-type recombinase/integrase [Breoghania sp. L-A4]|uniref:tyrosine-type recombinase/integrase n=1 Tax=Breoghania sp. L-A4 TaxID=2304600 RepID=UPI000E35E0C9|nr:tyrosine-type recombinase/integrase [Breoghania sp. L-A4]AXS39243.1 integrase [Breoghania sp. L-A4]
MTRRLPYVQRETSRHGRVTWYFRRGKGARQRLPGKHGSPEFTVAYNAALAGLAAKAPAQPRAKHGTLAWLFQSYKASAAFAALAPSTRRVRANLMDGISKRAGPNALIVDITPAVIRRGREDRADRPGAANNFLKTLRAVFGWAFESELVDADPTRSIKLLAESKTGFRTWTPSEIEQYQSHWPLGTKARLALDLLAFTGLRRSDIVRLGCQHVRNGALQITAQKNGELITLPILPALQASIEATSTGDTVFLVTEFGKPFSAAGFGNWFRKKCEAAGVTGSAHGMRKAAATLAAEQGATTSELMAVFGWSSSKMAELYTRAADRKRLAMQAGAKLAREHKAE